MSDKAILIGDPDIGPFDTLIEALAYKEEHGLDKHEVWPLHISRYDF